MHLPAQSIRHYMIDNAETYFPCLKVLNRLNMKSKYSSSFLPVSTEWNDLVLLSNMTIEYLHDDSASWLLPFSSSYSRTGLRKYNLQGEFLSCSHFRVDDWLLMSSPWPTVGLCLLYYYIIRVAGPNYMKNREPFNIQNIVVFYNLFQTIFSIWIFAKATKFWFTGVICYIKWVLPSKYILLFRKVQLVVSACGL